MLDKPPLEPLPLPPLPPQPNLGVLLDLVQKGGCGRFHEHRHEFGWPFDQIILVRFSIPVCSRLGDHLLYQQIMQFTLIPILAVSEFIG